MKLSDDERYEIVNHPEAFKVALKAASDIVKGHEKALCSAPMDDSQALLVARAQLEGSRRVLVELEKLLMLK